MAESEGLSPRNVLYCASYGRFGISEGFKKYLTGTSVKFQDYDIDCARHDPALINAIADFGHSVCKKVPHILADFRTSGGRCQASTIRDVLWQSLKVERMFMGGRWRVWPTRFRKLCEIQSRRLDGA